MALDLRSNTGIVQLVGHRPGNEGEVVYVEGNAIAYTVGAKPTSGTWADSQFTAWCRGNEYYPLLWRNDGPSQREVIDRQGLHQALFLLRAEIANVLILQDVNTVVPISVRELVLAEARQARARVVTLDGVDLNADCAEELRSVRAVARAGATLRAELFPRPVEYDDFGGRPAIGAWDNKQEAARLAHKLRHDFGLTFDDVANVLNADGWYTARDAFYTGPQVHHLLREVPDDLHVTTSERARRRTAAAETGSVLGCYTVGSTPIVPESARAFVEAEGRFEWVVPFADAAVVETMGEVVAVDLNATPGLRQLLMLAQTGMLASVWFGSEEIFGSAVTREVVYAEFWEAGCAVHAGDVVVDPLGTPDEVTAILRPIARDGATLGRMLRLHDEYTVRNALHDVDRLKEVVRTLRAKEWTFDRIARKFDSEGVPTRKRVGSWHAAAVRELLDE